MSGNPSDQSASAEGLGTPFAHKVPKGFVVRSFLIPEPSPRCDVGADRKFGQLLAHAEVIRCFLACGEISLAQCGLRILAILASKVATEEAIRLEVELGATVDEFRALEESAGGAGALLVPDHPLRHRWMNDGEN
ncbi:hypothetical protein [Roseomonas sp. USHLN139]|uniref:hypothetical protein n=1 Tax=Roseomonas sp. USHLN139 TaxID=3081298 RepID=UPI003B015BB0